MLRRLSFIPLALLLSVCLVVLPACKKKKPPEEEGGGGGGGSVPASVNSDYLAFARLKIKDLRDSTVYTELTQAFAKAGGTEMWDQFEKGMGKEIGIRPTDIDTVTAVATEAPPKGAPKFVLIIESSKSITKGAGFGVQPGTRADSRGFYKNGADTLVHYPNDKTVVVVSESLTDQYLNGYAKNTVSGWPLTTDLTLAANRHTLFAVVNLQKVPREDLDKNDARDFAGMLTAQKLTITADLKGKEISLGARATFPDSTSAGKAKDEVLKVLMKATRAVDEAANETFVQDFPSVKPVVAEAQRAVKNVRIDAVGSDLTLSASYKADFDIGQIVTDAVKQFKDGAPRMTASNNMKQIALGLINYSDTMASRMPIHAIGANAQPVRGPNDKPLLSWRVAILPYIEQNNLYSKFKLNEPWDSPNNIKLLKEMPKIYAPTGKPTPAGKEGFTHIQMVIGNGGMRLGSVYPQSIQDGTSNTIAVIETVDMVEWTKPADIEMRAQFAPGDLKKKFGGQFDKGIMVGMWDGSSRMIPSAVSENTLKLLFDPSDGQVVPNDWLK